MWAEIPAWQGARTAHTPRIERISNAARLDGSTPKYGIFARGLRESAGSRRLYSQRWLEGGIDYLFLLAVAFFLAGAFFLAVAFFLAAFFLAGAFLFAGAFFFAVANALTPFPELSENLSNYPFESLTIKSNREKPFWDSI